MIIKRISYGASFNDIKIIDGKIIKSYKNEYGKKKMDDEISFYKFIIDNNINFPIPKIYSLNNTIEMEYLSNYIPLYTYLYNAKYNNIDKNTKYNNIDKYNDIINKIYNELGKLHKIEIDKQIEWNDIKYEIYDKILERNKDFDNKYNIKYVNGIRIMSFEDILNKINGRIAEWYNNIGKNNKYVLIHGDCQFNNILYNKNNGDIKFIDPRGYFGMKKLYGIKEYDYAKVSFALSGYDIFDNKEYNELKIIDDKIEIDIKMLDENIFDEYNIINDLVIIIWLGNSHCFTGCKKYISYYIALYFGTKYLMERK